MSRGILQSAATGKLPLQLEYRVLTALQELRADMQVYEPADQSTMPFVSGSFETTYGEY